MDLLKSFAGGSDDKPASGERKNDKKHSTTELLGSAKVVADAAKSAASGGAEKVDKAKTAGAASDLLDAACDYGKLSDKGYGKYVDQARDYLHQYEKTPAKSSDHHDQAAKPPAPSDHQDNKDGNDDNKSEGGGGGVGGYLKMAQGFMK